MKTCEIDDDKVQALRRALKDFNRYGVDHSEDCPHRTYCDAPCPGGDSCEESADLAPCDVHECWAAASEQLCAAVEGLLASLGASS